MRMYGRLALHAESVVLPLLAPDAPVVTWWNGVPPHLIAHDPLGVSADRRVTDCAAATDQLAALAQRAADYVPGDTDLSWARTTPWRGPAGLGLRQHRRCPAVRPGRWPSRGAPAPRCSAAGCRAGSGVPVERVDQGSEGIAEVDLEVEGTRLTLRRTDRRSATLSRTDQPDRVMPLPRRDLGELLAEELRRLDADEPYAEALAAATGDDGPLSPAGARTHIWQDPAEQPA